MADFQFTAPDLPTSLGGSPTSELKAAVECFRDYLFSRSNLADTTIGNYLGTITRALPVIGVRPSEQMVERYFSALRRSGKSNSYATYVAVALERYMEMIGTPIRLGRPPQPKRVLKHVLSEAEVTLLIAATRTKRERAMMAVLAYSGIRNEEFTKLVIDDIDISGQTIHIAGKGAKERRSCIGGQCVEALVDYLNERDGRKDEYLFVTVRNGLQLEPQDVRKFVRVQARRASIKKRVHPHLLRHSLATNMLLRGASLLTIRDQLGHEFLESTMAYLHVVQSQMKRDYRSNTPSYM